MKSHQNWHLPALPSPSPAEHVAPLHILAYLWLDHQRRQDGYPTHSIYTYSASSSFRELLQFARKRTCTTKWKGVQPPRRSVLFPSCGRRFHEQSTGTYEIISSIPQIVESDTSLLYKFFIIGTSVAADVPGVAIWVVRKRRIVEQCIQTTRHIFSDLAVQPFICSYVKGKIRNRKGL